MLAWQAGTADQCSRCVADFLQDDKAGQAAHWNATWTQTQLQDICRRPQLVPTRIPHAPVLPHHACVANALQK